MAVNQKYKNPLGLKLGNHVLVHSWCYFAYNSVGIKQLYRIELRPPEKAVVIGITRKAVGKYKTGVITFQEEEPPRLIVERYYRVYVCKTNLESEPFFVLPEDLTKPKRSKNETGIQKNQVARYVLL